MEKFAFVFIFFVRRIISARWYELGIQYPVWKVLLVWILIIRSNRIFTATLDYNYSLSSMHRSEAFQDDVSDDFLFMSHFVASLKAIQKI